MVLKVRTCTSKYLASSQLFEYTNRFPWFAYSTPTLYATWWRSQAQYQVRAGSSEVSMNRRVTAKTVQTSPGDEFPTCHNDKIRHSFSSLIFMFFGAVICCSIAIRNYMMYRVILYTCGAKAVNIMQICTRRLMFKNSRNNNLWKYPSSYMLLNICIAIRNFNIIMCRVILHTIGKRQSI